LAEAPLAGTVVLDLTRMLPGAVLARQLLDLGARLIKVEPPGGDPFRHAPPLLEVAGAGFAWCYAGAESVVLDLSTAEGIATLERLALHADVLVESFRPGRLESWGMDRARIRRRNPGLVWCSLPGYPSASPLRDRPAHDLDLVAASGALAAMGGEPLPRIPLADVATGLLAATAVLAALLARERTGAGADLEQPLATGPLPFLAWTLAERAGGGAGVAATLLSGRLPCYRTYRTADGRRVAVAALEPKFWAALVEALGLSGEAAAAAFGEGPEAEAAVRELEARFAGCPLAHWLELAARRELPLAPVNEPDSDEAAAHWRRLGLSDDRGLPGPLHPSLAGPERGPAPRLGEHTARVLAELA